MNSTPTPYSASQGGIISSQDAALVQQGLTAAQVLERLPDLLARMDDRALTAALTRTAFAARAGFEAGFDQADA